MLKPELQGLEDFVDGINNIVEAQQKVALRYFEDNSISAAIPPLKILLHIMAYGNYKGKEISNPELRNYFKRDYVLNSDWYKKRLVLKQEKEVTFYKSQIKYLTDFIANSSNKDIVIDLKIKKRLQKVKENFDAVSSPEYLESLIGTIGADPLFKKTSQNTNSKVLIQSN
jgi:hypothetical protein